MGTESGNGTTVSASATSSAEAFEVGSRPPVVFLHGYPLSRAIWEPLRPRLPEGSRMVPLDLPGYGPEGPEPVPTTLAGFAESVNRTVGERGVAQAVVVGHSFGGYIALELYRRHPERFAGLVLTDTRSEADAPAAKEKRLATIRRLEDPAQRLDADEVVRGLLAPATWESGGPLVDELRRIVRSVPSRTVIASLQAIAGRPDLTPVLPTIEVPTLVVWGEEDALIPPDRTKALVPHIRGAAGVGIPRAGHLPFMEAPDRFMESLGAFLNRIGSG